MVETWWDLFLNLPVLLLGLGLVLAVLEVLLPSGGLLGVVAAGVLTTAVILAFTEYGEGFGLLILLAVAVGVPIVVVWGFSFWPETPLGKQMLLEPPRAEDVLPEIHTPDSLRRWIGEEAEATSPLRPSGVVRIGRTELPAISRLGAVGSGQKVRIVDVRGANLIVEPAPESERILGEGSA